jgi:hypothetical protein
MPATAEGENRPTRARVFAAWVILALTLAATWKFIDYRTQPPPPPAVAAPR